MVWIYSLLGGPASSGAAAFNGRLRWMNVTRIRLRNFRNHDDTTVEFGESLNVLLGGNGQGKTNILEAISFLCLTKSFYAAGDSIVLQIGKDYFDVEGTIVADSGIEHTVRVAYQKSSEEKQVAINHARPETLASVIGRFPIVVLSPENNGITFGAPSDRRKFIDLTLSQLSTSYFADLLEYRKVVRQRNRVLAEARLRAEISLDLIDPWTVGVAKIGGRIMLRRKQFIDELTPYVTSAHRKMAQNGETPQLKYIPSCSCNGWTDAESISMALDSEIRKRMPDEIQRGLTLVGPHRDELGMTLDGISVQKYASQGQHKTLLVALKVAEFLFLRERRNEIPVFLLDDVFSELDERRVRSLLELIGSLGQTVITATEASVFHDTARWNEGRHRRFRVESGTCQPE